MTPLIVASVLSMLALDAGQATSKPPAPTPTPTAVTVAQQSDADDPNKMICHNEPITGSRFVKRVCMTRADWGELERRTEQLTRTFNEGAGRNNAASSNGAGMTGN
jgi:hypothetical protein